MGYDFKRKSLGLEHGFLHNLLYERDYFQIIVRYDKKCSGVIRSIFIVKNRALYLL